MSAASVLPGQSPYAVSRPAGQCAVTREPILPGQSYMAVLSETVEGLARTDISLDAWPKFDASKSLAFWKSVMPHPEQERKKPFVDDEVLLSLFERLNDTTEPQKLHFRFVLGLILMRKRLLVYESSEIENGNERWHVRVRGKAEGKTERLSMLNPRLTEEQVKAVSSQLGEIMNEDL